MTNLYSYKKAYPYPLPEDVYNYNINDFKLAPQIPEIPLGKFLEWDGGDWVIRDPNENELIFKWYEIRQQRNQLLANSDIYVLKYYENNTPVSLELKEYRQSLRDITTQENPWNIVWPTIPSNL